MAIDQSTQQFLLAHCPKATGDPLPARLIPEESGDPRQHCFHIDGIVEHYDGTRADGGTDGTRALEGQRRVELLRGEKCASRSTQQDGLKRASLSQAICQVQQRLQGRAERDLVDTWARDT